MLQYSMSRLAHLLYVARCHYNDKKIQYSAATKISPACLYLHDQRFIVHAHSLTAITTITALTTLQGRI